MNTPKRYHPVLVTLHWLTVVLLLGAGILAGGEGSNSPIDPHMVFGVLLFVVILVRLVVRFTTKHPAWADTGNAILNKLGVLVHYGLYFAVFLILGVGGIIGYKRNLFAYAIGSSATVERGIRSLNEIHQMGWLLVILLILGHVGAALYHQFVLKDNLLSRMWYGK